MSNEREVEAVARVFADNDGYRGSAYVPEAYFPMAKRAIEALDRVRDARGDDEEGPVIVVNGEEVGRGADGMLNALDRMVPPRSPQDEDHEAGIEAAREAGRDAFHRWMRDSRYAERDGLEVHPGEAVADFVLAAYLSRVSPSRVGSVAEGHEAVDVHRCDVEWCGVRWIGSKVRCPRGHDEGITTERFFRVHSRVDSMAVEDVLRYFDERGMTLTAREIRQAVRELATDRPEQPEPDVLGGQPPAEPAEPKEKDERRP
jgi:hypothetical protein